MEGISAEDYLRQSITQPSIYLVDGYADIMYKDYAERLSEEDINNLIAYLMTLTSEAGKVSRWPASRSRA